MTIPRWYATGQKRPAISRSSWDILTVGGEKMPGRTRITQGSVAWKVDAKKATGKDADRPTKFGFESRPFVFEVEVINVEEMEAVNRILAPYIPRPGANMDPMAVDHPSLNHLVGFFAVTVREVSRWEADGPRRKLTVTCATWVPNEKPAAKGRSTKVQTPNKLPVNKRRDDAQKRGLQGGANTAPKDQAGFCGPSFAPGT